MCKVRLGTLHSGRIKGWAFDRSSPESSVTIDVAIGEELLISGVRADILRPDLEQAGIGDGRHGFEVALPNSIYKKLPLSVTIRRSGRREVLLHEKLRVDNPSRGFSADFDFAQFLRWSYTEDRMPYGQVDDIPALLEAIESERMPRIARCELAPPTDLVSVVMPVFNREKIVGEAIESVLAQTHRNFELLIVDDGSTDDSVPVSKRFGDPRIRLIALARNGGVSAARNAGLREARGPFIAYIDSDNTWSPHYLAVMLDAFRMAPEATTAYAGQEIWEYLPQDDRDEFRFLRMAPFNRRRLERRNFIDLNVFMHRRSCYDERGGFNESMRRLVDWELILRYTEPRAPVFLPVTLGRYRIGRADNQITFVEDHASNLALLRLPTPPTEPRAADDASSALSVFVHARDAEAYARWRQANPAVVAGCRHLAAAWSKGMESAEGVGPDGAATVFPSVPAALAAHCDGLGEESLLLVDAASMPSGRSAQADAIASHEGRLDTPTGRPSHTAETARSDELFDEASPLRIESPTDRSESSRPMQGFISQRISSYCLIFTPEAVRKLKSSAICAKTIQICLGTFFEAQDEGYLFLCSEKILASLNV